MGDLCLGGWVRCKRVSLGWGSAGRSDLKAKKRLRILGAVVGLDRRKSGVQVVVERLSLCLSFATRGVGGRKA